MKKFSKIALLSLVAFCGYNNSYCMDAKKYPELLMKEIRDMQAEDDETKQKIKLLLEKGTKLNQKDYDNAIFKTLSEGFGDIFELIIKHLWSSKNPSNICMAIHYGKIDVLLRHGLYVNTEIADPIINTMNVIPDTDNCPHGISGKEIGVRGKGCQECACGTLLDFAIAMAKCVLDHMSHPSNIKHLQEKKIEYSDYKIENNIYKIIEHGGILSRTLHDKSSKKLLPKIKGITDNKTFSKFVFDDLANLYDKNIEYIKEMNYIKELYKNNRFKFKDIKAPSLEALSRSFFLHPYVIEIVKKDGSPFLIKKLNIPL